ncbi:thioredoxin family protein [Sphingomonas sp. PB4P5]|uniref:thioredoxin family protein n=1 Tax=Parasphingomonas puruogangriensis TaxID=3096155 RepID=UPI002FC75FFC
MRYLITLFAISALAAPLAAAPAPRMPISSFEQLATPLPLPYDAQANATQQVTAAKARARAGHKLLLIDLGGNWCLDCRLLAGAMDVAPLKAFLARHYEIVTVDVGRFDKNLAIPARYGITKRLEGVPSLLIVDPRNDKLLNAGRTAALADARSMSPQGLADWLAQWVK